MRDNDVINYEKKEKRYSYTLFTNEKEKFQPNSNLLTVSMSNTHFLSSANQGTRRLKLTDQSLFLSSFILSNQKGGETCFNCQCREYSSSAILANRNTSKPWTNVLIWEVKGTLLKLPDSINFGTLAVINSAVRYFHIGRVIHRRSSTAIKATTTAFSTARLLTVSFSNEGTFFNTARFTIIRPSFLIATFAFLMGSISFTSI